MTEQRKGSVMIVDDAPGNLAFLSDALVDAGYEVLVATDGSVALEQLKYVTPDVILLDAVMPQMDGFETCRRLQADPLQASIPVIFMTALGELEYLLKAFSDGAVDYLVKPIRHEEVLARVAVHVTRARRVRLATDVLEHGGLAAMAVDDKGLVTWLTAAAAQWLGLFSRSCITTAGVPASAVSTADTATGEAAASDLLTRREALLERTMIDSYRVGDRLPPPLCAWVHSQLQKFLVNAGVTLASDDGTMPGEALPTLEVNVDGRAYSAKLQISVTGGEHFLLLQNKPDPMNIAAVRGSLGLTVREAEVIMWIARGKTNKDVAQILGSSPRTINKHLEHIFEKLGVETRTAAVSVVMNATRQH